MNPGAPWHVEITPAARRDLRRLDKQALNRMLAALDGLRSEPARGDVKRLSGVTPPEWRLRVGSQRVRFARDRGERVVLILRVLPRGRAYRD